MYRQYAPLSADGRHAVLAELVAADADRAAAVGDLGQRLSARAARADACQAGSGEGQEEVEAAAASAGGLTARPRLAAAAAAGQTLSPAADRPAIEAQTLDRDSDRRAAAAGPANAASADRRDAGAGPMERCCWLAVAGLCAEGLPAVHHPQGRRLAPSADPPHLEHGLLNLLQTLPKTVEDPLM